MLLAFAVACGVPGEPLPPLLEIPLPVEDLTATQVGAQVRLVFSLPRLTTEGTRVRRLDRMEIYGVFLPTDAPLASFPEQSSLLATVRADEIPAQQEQVVYAIPLETSRIGEKVFLAVKAVNWRGKDADFSNVVPVAIANLPEPPSDLRATLTEKAVRLIWQPASQSVFGGPAPRVEGYQVWRKEVGSVEAAQLLGDTATPAYDDSSFEFGRQYEYFVRAFVKTGDSLATTPLSGPALIAAVDRFPPAPPQNARGLAARGNIELTWSPNSEPDLAGYNVYRSENDVLERRNPELLLIPVFRDSNVRPGIPYRYQIRATDKNGNESASSEEVSITVEEGQ